MKKQLKANPDSSTSALTSETSDIKSEPVRYVDRPSENSSSNKYPKEDYRNCSLATRGNNDA